MGKATAVANPNIAFIKYWGKNDPALNLPANPSLSMNLAALTTVTTVEFKPGLASDIVELDGSPAAGQALHRVVAHLDRVRTLGGTAERARVTSRSDFPVGTGLASSASGFAALSLAAAQAAGLQLSDGTPRSTRALSRLARLGSGSACRSIPGGFVLWEGESDETSYARQLAPPDHWDLQDVIALVSRQHKTTTSYDGHDLAASSPFHAARLAALPGALAAVKSGIEHRDLHGMGPAIERDALAMHGVMMTSQPMLLYWEPATVAVLQAIQSWRKRGLAVYFTMDAGPNVHCLCEAADAAEVEARLRDCPGVQDVIVSGPGVGARLLAYHLF